MGTTNQVEHIHALVKDANCAGCLKIINKDLNDAIDVSIGSLGYAYIALGNNYKSFSGGEPMPASHPIAIAQSKIKSNIERINKLRGVEN